MTESPDNSQPPSEEFVQLFTRHQRPLYLFLLTQCPNPIEAEEILQETNVIIWKKYSQFSPGTNFFAWTCKIARYEFLKHRDRRMKDRIVFSDEFISTVAAEVEERSATLEQRREALIECLRKLNNKDRELIEKRYSPGESGKSVAAFLGRPANAVYQSLSRIRKTLHSCVTRQMGSMGSAATNLE